ncbi:MAG: DUF4255 domain-containing protein [Methylophilus sp.]|jgi:hypothetical protein
MIAHALTIVINEMEIYLPAATVGIGNIALGVGGTDGVPKDILNISVVNIKEEKALKNLPHVVRDDVKLTANYQNPPVFLNFLILITATHATYADALLMLSRAIRFFQNYNVFTQDTVAPLSLTKKAPNNTSDQLQTFKLIFDLYSPTMEEVNHLWGTLGGKQYPFVLYNLRTLDLQFKAVPAEGGLITEVVTDVYHKDAVAL